jgi:hypothetical protein
MFNRRHYEFVAEVLNAARKEVDITHPEASIRLTTISNVAWKFGDAFALDNPQFDLDKFFHATVEGVTRRPRKAV